MLQVFRDHAHKWFVKVLLWLIVLSFALWGIGDVVYKFFANRPIIKVGKHSISHEELAHHLQKETSRINEMTKGRITAQQLKSLKIQHNVIDRLISQLVLSDELERMNLSVSDEVLKEQIQAMPSFQTSGKFDENKFIGMLHHQSMSEHSFLKEARNSILSQQLLGSISMGAALPQFYVESLIDALTRKRVFTTIEIDPAKISADKTPSQEQLMSFYEQFKDRYLVPEYRSITVIMLDNAALRQLLGISSNDLHQAYEARKANFHYPERRQVKRLTYKQQEKAAKALEMANNGASFAKIAKEIPNGELEDLGLVTKEEMAEPITSKIFALEAGKTSEVISTDFGFNIFQVTKIESKKQATFAEVKEQLEATLVQEHKSSKIDEIRSKIDDALAAGQSLNDIASQMNLAIQTLENINAKGNFEDGKAVFKEANTLRREIIEKAFTTEQGMDSGFVDVPGEGAFVLYVDKTNPAYAPDFANIAKKISQDWQADQQLDAASKLASSIALDAKSLSALMSLATKHNLSLSTNHTLTRLEISTPGRKAADILPDALAEQAFMLAPETAMAGRNAKGGFTVVMLQKIGEISVTAAEKQKLQSNLHSMIQEDVIKATINALKELHLIEINQEMLAQMME